MSAKVGFANAIVQYIDANVSLSQRLLSAGKAGSIAALLEHNHHSEGAVFQNTTTTPRPSFSGTKLTKPENASFLTW